MRITCVFQYLSSIISSCHIHCQSPTTREIVMKILAFAASNSRSSINKLLVTHAADVLKSEISPNSEIEILDLNDFEMPIYSIDRETQDGIPQLAKDFYAKIGAADALLISYAEHNGYYTAAYKNIFDWMSRIEVQLYQNKPIIAMSASVGPGAAARVLQSAIDSSEIFGADIRDSLSVGPFDAMFDSGKGILTDEDLSAKLRSALKLLK